MDNINEFMNYVRELFCIKPYVHTEVKKAVEQFYDKNKKINCCAYNINKSELLQGDIIGDLPFLYIDAKGKAKQTPKMKGMIISNSCDIENDDYILIAPLLKIENLNGIVDLNAIKRNIINNLFNLFDSKWEEYVIDFSRINTFPKSIIMESLRGDQLKKEATLNDFGYYFFLCKLTIHLMRPESTEVNRENLGSA